MKARTAIALLAVCVILVASATSTAGQGVAPQSETGTRAELASVAPSAEAALSTGFAFQGGLSNAAGPVTGTCDFRFTLFGAASGGGQIGATLTRTNIQLANGLFAVELDFGDAFNSDPRWIEVGVRCPAGSGVFTTLSPRQSIAPTPYALTAKQALSAPGRFMAYGDVWSSVSPHDGVAGALVLENPVTRNRWTLPIRDDTNDRLDFDFWDAGANTWRYGASLDRSGNFVVSGAITAQSVYANGELWSARPSDGTSAGALTLENKTTGNRWNIPIRASDGDSLGFYFFDAGGQSWSRPLSLGADGNLTLTSEFSGDTTLLRLEHPKTRWYFHIDPTGHPEMGVRNNATGQTTWNVFDIDPTKGHVGLGSDATQNERLRVDGSLTAAGLTTVSTTNTGSGTLFQLVHPKTQVYFHVDPTGHPEIGIYSAATGQTRWDTLDFDKDTGHLGVGGTASATETLKVYGNFSATGTKAATVETESYGARKLYAIEAADVRFSDEGLAQLRDGTARIDLDPVFVETIEEPYIITVTPYGNASLYVAEIGTDHFTVKVHDGDGQITCAWRLSARRKGYGDVRLESAALENAGQGEGEVQP